MIPKVYPKPPLAPLPSALQAGATRLHTDWGKDLHTELQMEDPPGPQKRHRALPSRHLPPPGAGKGPKLLWLMAQPGLTSCLTQQPQETLKKVRENSAHGWNWPGEKRCNVMPPLPNPQGPRKFHG